MRSVEKLKDYLSEDGLTGKSEDDSEELELIETAIELELLDLDEIKEQVEKEVEDKESKEEK